MVELGCVFKIPAYVIETLKGWSYQPWFNLSLLA